MSSKIAKQFCADLAKASMAGQNYKVILRRPRQSINGGSRAGIFSWYTKKKDSLNLYGQA